MRPIHAQLCDEYMDLFMDAVRIQLRADVPIGTCLSGGVDSSSIVVAISQLMQREFGMATVQLGERQKTFSVVYDKPGRWNERQYVDSIIHNGVVDPQFVEPTAASLWSDAESLVWHQEEPFHSLSIFAGWTVMRLAAAAGIKVLLNGQGADEYLAGYRPFDVYLRELLLTGRILAAVREARRIRDVNSINVTSLIGSVLLPHLVRPVSVCRHIASTFSGRQHSLIGRWLKRELSSSGLLPEFKIDATSMIDGEWRHKQSKLSDHLSLELTEHSLPLLLRYEDRNSMAFSIESRVPFLDHRLVEFVFRRGNSLRICQGWTKWIHRRAVSSMLTPEVCWRTDKVGFEIPEGRWVREQWNIKRFVLRRFSGWLVFGFDRREP